MTPGARGTTRTCGFSGRSGALSSSELRGQWTHQGSNLAPLACRASALPAELCVLREWATENQPASARDGCRANGGSRTRDLLRGRQMLYRLSYVRLAGAPGVEPGRRGLEPRMLAFTSRPLVCRERGDRPGSNRQPPGSQPGALPFELRPPWIASAGIEPAWRSRMRAAGSPDPTRREDVRLWEESNLRPRASHARVLSSELQRRVMSGDGQSRTARAGGGWFTATWDRRIPNASPS